ncbi:uncharacterized protein [Anabrus simplex]|uniref:uncharacterized protein n=1 Tax=Anabrus simplex TaxID=316456 RepID=UPI0035A2DDDA
MEPDNSTSSLTNSIERSFVTENKRELFRKWKALQSDNLVHHQGAMSSSSSEDGEIIAIALACEEEERKERRFWIHEINLKREQCGEYNLLLPDLLRDEDKFFKYFRMSSLKFFELLSDLPLQKMESNFRKPISPGERLAVTMKFLGYGDSFASISFSYRLGESTVRKIVYETCRVIWDTLTEDFMPVPTKEHWQNIEEGYASLWQYPNCIGAIDGKHVVFEKPPNTGSLFFNYKKQFSIVLLALVDAEYRFITVDVGAYGRNSDGGIFRASNLGRRLINETLDLPGEKPLPGMNALLPHVIVGDEAFPLLQNVMRPFPGTQLANDERKQVYNYRHSRARRVSENAFGILTKKFRIYLKKFNISPEHLEIIVMATTVLHNYLRNDSCSWQLGELENNEVPLAIENLSRIGGNNVRRAFEIREKIADYFVSPQGRVPWQDRAFNRGVN